MNPGILSHTLPAGRRGQALAVGVTLLAMALLWFGIVEPARSFVEDQAATLEQRQALLHRMQQVAATLPGLRAAATDVPAAGAGAKAAMLPGASDAVAAADLQERIQKMAATAGTNLTAVETLPMSPAGKWHKVSLRVSLNAPWPVLMDLLRAIDSSPMRILVDDVHFHTATVVTRPVVLPVQASMVVYGFRPADTGTGT
jgi:general secretion pathway protein M